ncbi:MAG: HD domain-containing protein [Bacilli bacterium]|nr:HD domain-containing protein [Bacilli bacterium]MDD4795901.1 HD domain-containing protein [Bacilli bacterium]
MKYGVVSFDVIAKEIINNDKYKKLKKESHHGLTRYDHSLRVAKKTYNIATKLNVDYISATRAALLHDFFTNTDFKNITGLDKGKMHPKLALANADAYFNLNKKEKDAILNHMFPLTLIPPTSIEGIIVTTADKAVALYEYSRFKLTATLTIWFLFLFNLLTFSNN